MTPFFQTLLSFAAVVVLAAFAARTTKLPSGLAPLPVLCGVMVLCVLGGYLGVLPQTVWLIFALALAALVHMALTAKQGGFRALLTPGFVLFCVAGVVFIGFLAVRKPVPQGWDEFSLWATAAKLTKTSDMIYSAAPSGYPWPNTQKPGFPTLSYFFNFFGPYEAWRMYAAYDLLMVAVWSAALGSFRWKHWQLSVPVTVVMFLLPYLPVYARSIYCDFSYLSAYADYPMAILTAGALVWYYHMARLHKIGHPPLQSGNALCARLALPLAVMAAAIVLCKDTGLPLACIAAMVITVDLLFVNASGGNVKIGAEKADKKATSKTANANATTNANANANTKKSKAKPGAAAAKTVTISLKAKLASWLSCFGVSAAMFAGAGGIFLASSRYLASLGTAQGSVGGDSDMGYATLLIEGTKQLLGLSAGEAGAPYVEKFSVIKAEMIKLFMPAEGGANNVTMLGCGLFVLLAVWAMCAVTAVLCKDKLHRRTTVLYGVFSTLGFFAYYIFIGFTYVYVFKKEGTASIIDYNRYINTYYVLWLGAAAVLLALGAAYGSRFKNSLTLGTLALGSVLLFRFTQLVQPQLCMIDYPDAVYTEVNAVRARAQAVQAVMEPGARVFYVNDSGDNGLGWFRSHYELLPGNILEYGNGGDMFADPRHFETLDAAAYVENYKPVLPREEFAAYLVQHGCEYVYLDVAYSEFYESYRALLPEGGQESYQGRSLLYKVNVKGSPVYEDMTAADMTYAWEADSEGNVAVNKNGETRVKMVNAVECVSLTPVAMEVPVV